MPYKLDSDGISILHQKAGKWSVKQKSSSHKNAIKTLALLRGIESGKWKPTQKK